MPEDRFFEDLSVGDKFATSEHTLSEAALLAFAREFDPQPMHTDKAAAEAGPFQGLIASGWYTAALVIKLIAEARPWGNTPMLGLGVDSLRWPHPVHAGDRITVHAEITAVRESRSNPGFGIVTMKVQAVNQDGQLVYEVEPSCWVPKRDANGSQ